MASYDPLTVSKLAQVSEFDMYQTFNIDDAFTCSIFPNMYTFSDRGKMMAVPGTERQLPTPVFIAKEESSCCCRMCCSTCQPMTIKLYHADPNVLPGQACCGNYKNMRYNTDPANADVIASFDRPGCGTKILGAGCPTFCACCQDEVFMFPGNKVGEPGKLAIEGDFIATSVQPICGGGCTPTLELSEHSGGAAQDPYAFIEGPTCFGGCKDLFCRTPFMISTQKGKAGDLGSIIKKTPDSMLEMCCAMCTDVDGYEVNINTSTTKLTDTQKLNFLGSAVQLDFMFFEKDNDLCYVSDDGGCIYITLCNWYMCGLLCPVQACIPLKQDGQ